MAKVEFRIVGVRQRTEAINDTLLRIGCDSDIVRFDDAREGCLKNKLHLWKGSIPFDSDTTHVCLLDDDADVVNGFVSIAEKCASNFGGSIFSFFSDKLEPSEETKITPYVFMRNCNVKGIAIMLPVELIAPYVDFTERLMRKYNYRHDDGACRIFSILNDISVFCTVPNLVKEKDIPSTFTGHSKAKSASWAGYSIDTKAFDTRKFVVSKGFPINSHLPKKCPEDILLKEAIERRALYWESGKLYTRA